MYNKYTLDTIAHIYKVGATKDQTLGYYGLGFSFGSLATTVRREVYIYSFVSFVSEFGGSLGLFVGFSFFVFWDIAKDCLVIVGHNLK